MTTPHALEHNSFNLEKFQSEFKAGKFGEFHYYTTLVKALAQLEDKTSLQHLSTARAEPTIPEDSMLRRHWLQHHSTARAEQLDAIAFDRFFNLTCEKNNKAQNLILYTLDVLQKNTGIQLHQDTITFPSRFFNPQSELSKHQNVIDYTDFLLWKIENYSKAHAEQLSKANALYSQLADLKNQNQNLQPIQQYLLQKFDFSLQNLETKLLQFKSQSIQYLEKMDNLTSISDFIQVPFCLDFNLYGETVTRLYNNQIEKVANFSQEIDILQQLFIKIKKLFHASQNFSTQQKEQLRLNCQKEYVEENFEKIFAEWQTEINEIESQYLPMIQAYFIGTMNQTATLQALTLLEEYRHAVDNFFATERIALIQKYHDNPKTEFLQRIDKESKLFKSRCDIVNGLKNLIVHEPQHLAKKSLNTLSENLFSRQIDSLLNFSQDANLALQLQTEFMELQQRNFETYLADVEQYGKELDKRDKEIQGLIFKMKKDLERQNNATPINSDNTGGV